MKHLPAGIGIIALLLAAQGLAGAVDAGDPSATRAGGPPALHVEGNRLKNGSGEVVRLRGVNIPSLEWSNTGDHMTQSVCVAIEDWRANFLRLPLCQDRWFGKAPGQSDDGAGYRLLVSNLVELASARRAYALLDLHWSDANDWGKNIRQHKMPDLHSVDFWKSLAAGYANHPAVLFDLYNEPRGVSWEIWRNGGAVTETNRVRGSTNVVSYQAVGLQSLLEVVRGVGARNIVVINGLDWGYDLTGVTNGYALKEHEGNGIMYGSHIYPWKGANASQWDSKVGMLADKYPLLVGEFGCSPGGKYEAPEVWAPRILTYLEERQLNWLAWCFHDGASPRLLQRGTFEPTPYWGVFAKAALLKARAR